MSAGRVRLLADGGVPRGSHEQQNSNTLLPSWSERQTPGLPPNQEGAVGSEVVGV